ncbi:MAG TPA: TlpA disulfide reductase family protein, partial [Bacteroidia bacterium]|nr:TlpA disulfide reductase family protein [Bacteroidia bacterium]
FLCKRETDTCFSGVFVNNAASHPYRIPFRAKYTPPGPNVVARPDSIMLDGKWQCQFSPGTSDSSNAIGLFSTDHSSGEIRATFLTETGDYRYIGGNLIGNSTFLLHTFDGSHAWVFKLKRLDDGTVTGDVWYGNYAHENFIAKRNKHYQLRDPYHLTYVTDSSKIGFTFTDLNGKPVSLSDPQFKNKVVIIQVMGSWCPNCMDETAEMAELYKKYHAQGLEIVALAYERSTDTAVANANIRRVKNKFDAQYTFLNTGKSGAKAASASLPFLNGIMAFPTTVIIDRKGKVVEVYTGYNGPATGDAYINDKENMELLITTLLSP